MTKIKNIKYTEIVSLSLLTLFLLVACSSTGSKIDFSLKNEDVIDLGKQYTKTAKIYRDLDTILVGDVLWYSADLRRGYLDEMKEKGRIDDIEYQEEIEHLALKDAREIDFIAGFYSSERKWDDFANKSSIWNIRLLGREGKLIAPRKILKLKARNIPDAHLFPFITGWKSIYRISFDRDDDLSGVENYQLKVYSILGETSFFWEISETERLKPAYERDSDVLPKIQTEPDADKSRSPKTGNGKINLPDIVNPLDIGIKPSIKLK